MEVALSTVKTEIQFKSPLFKMTHTTPTSLWNDSACIEELEYSIEHGAVGATCNPSIAVSVIKQEIAVWKPRIRELAVVYPTATEDEIAWMVVEEMSANAARLLKPVFDEHKGRNGRLSIQTDPHYYRNSNAMLEQAIRFSKLAPNMIVKIAATKAGIRAMEEATYRGISINATVSFTLPQAIAVAEAVERGLKRREAENLDISTMGPVCTIMVGRLDDPEGVARQAQFVRRSWVFRVGRSSSFQKGIPDFPRARISSAPSLSGFSQPYALERVHRRRCCDFTAVCMATPL